MRSSTEQPPSAAPGVHVYQDADVVQVITIQDGATVHDIIGQQNVYQYTPPRPADAATLRAAQALLHSMPTSDAEPPPAIAPLPTGSQIKGFRPNALFVGRTNELRVLARALITPPGGPPGRPPIVISTGIGGIGKTQLAIEFAQRYGQYFAGGVFWVTMEHAQTISSEVATCGAGGLADWRPDYTSLKLAEQLALVLAAWQSPLPRLLIFDNCEDAALLAQWCPPAGGCRVLVTSRRSSWDLTLGATVLRLDVLPRDASIALLRRFRPQLSAADADAIAAELGDLPLALHVAGSFLNAYRNSTPLAFLTDLRSPQLLNHAALQGRGSALPPTGRELNVAKVFALSYDRLDADDPTDTLAIALLARAACFAPGVPLARAMLTMTVAPEAADAALLIEDALRRLADLGLIEEQHAEQEHADDLQENAAPDSADAVAEAVETVRLHRLLSAFARQVSNDATARPAVEDVLVRVTRQIDAATFLAKSRLMLPHLRHVADAALPRADARAAILCNTIGRYLHGMTNYPAARRYFERALAICEQGLGTTHRDTAACLNNLGLLLRVQGDLAGARSCYERAGAILEQVLRQLSDEQTLATGKQMLRSTLHAIANNRNNLGLLLRAQGDLVTARSHLERAWEIHKKVLGPDHRDTANSLNNLGELLYTMGDLAGALPHLEQALAIYEQVLGPDHPGTATILANLGSLLQAMGDLAGARPCLERALAIRKQMLGPDHPDTAHSFNNLGELLQAMSDLAGARPYLERALAIREQMLDPNHPDTAISLNNLGILHANAGRFSEALPLIERTLAIGENRLGAAHPDTLVVRQTLIDIQAAMQATP